MKNNWISVKDRLPPFKSNPDDILVLIRGRRPVICWPEFWGSADGEYGYGVTRWHKSEACDCVRSDIDSEKVTHWMPIELP